MATKKRERIGIWIIALTMAIGSLGVYFSIILANNNGGQKSDQALLDEYLRQQEEFEDAARKNAEASEPLDGYSPSLFDAVTVTSLQVNDLKVGDGKEVKDGDTVIASYFGWTPDGKIFDSSKKNGTNKPPEDGFTLREGGLILGWVKGIPGMKVGGVRELTIPGDMAYGESGNPPLIGPNTPLKFIVRVEGVQE